VYAHPYCTCNSSRNVPPRHASSARAEDEIQTNTPEIGIVISIKVPNSLKCTVTPDFFSIDHFPCWLSIDRKPKNSEREKFTFWLFLLERDGICLQMRVCMTYSYPSVKLILLENEGMHGMRV